MLREIESLTTLLPKYARSLGSLGAAERIFNEVKPQSNYIYAFIYLPYLE